MRQLTNELSFDRPAGLFDRTHHIFTVTEDGPSPLTIVVSRSRIADGATLGEMADRIVVDLERTLADFHLLGREPTAVGEREAVMLRFRWQQGEMPLFQEQAAVVDEADGERFLVQLAATATAAATAAQIAMFDDVLASVTFREAAPR